jgi:hypothetical protein
MRERRSLYFALGVMTVVSLGAVTNQLAPSANPLVLRDEGIQFPDGTIQRTAAPDLGSAARSSFRYDCSADLPDGVGGGQCSFPAVPTGKMAVVEFFEGLVQLPLDQRAEMRFEGAAYGVVYVRHQYSNPDLVLDFSVVSEPHRLYLDEGLSLTVFLSRYASAGNGFFQVWVTGYLVDKTA